MPDDFCGDTRIQGVSPVKINLPLYAVLGLLLFVVPVFGQVSGNTRFFGPAAAREFFRVVKFEPFVEKKSVLLDESQASGFRYVTPLFFINATVTCLNEDVSRSWKIGFVQVMTEAAFSHQYENGENGWVFPSIPVNDSTGTEFPWYRGKKGMPMDMARPPWP